MPQKCVYRAGDDLSEIFPQLIHQDVETDESTSDGDSDSDNSSQAGSDTPTEASNAGDVNSASDDQRPEGGQATTADAEASTRTPHDSQQPTDPAGNHAAVDATEPDHEAADGNMDGSVNGDQAAPSSSGFAAGGAADDPEDLETVARNAIAVLNNTTIRSRPESSPKR